MMWKIKKFASMDGMNEWLVKNGNKVQWQEIFIANTYAIEYRKLRRIY